MSRWDQYFKDQQAARDTSGGNYVFLMLDNIDAKSSALLTHVSIMMAVAAVLYVDSKPDTFWRWIISIEILGYISVAIGCLTCINIIGPDSESASTNGIRNKAIGAVKYRWHMYRLCLFGAIGLTLFLALTFLLHISSR
mgnify:CR=1 FL=1